MAGRLRVGVLGLGRRWSRYRRALTGAALRPLLEVRALGDPRAARAEREARRLGCAAACGPTELVERDDVDAVLLLGRAWWRLWPLGPACRAGKRAFCGVSLAADEEHADALRQQVRAGGLAVALAPAPGLDALTERLPTLLREQLGPARLVRAEQTARRARAPLGPAALALLRACADVFAGPPVAVRATGAQDAPGFVSLVLEFGAGRVAHLSLGGGAARPGCRLAVVAERGGAALALPGRLEGRGPEGGHALQLAPGLAEESALRRFAEGQPPRHDFEAEYAALTWLRAARVSLAEGRRVEVPG
jgi:predicted dehydrogenase